MLLLNNDDVAAVLTMKECMDAHEAMYRAMSEDRALHHARRDTIAPGPFEGSVYWLTVNDGYFASPQGTGGLAAVRIVSQQIHWPTHGGSRRIERVRSATGLVLLYSAETGDLVAVMPDQIIQRMRVAAAAGVAVRVLARRDASILGLLGSGWQSGAALMAAAEARSFHEVRVYSPTPSNREAFAQEWSRKLDLPVTPVGTAREAVEGVDVVLASTSAIEPVLRAEWVSPGTHVGTSKQQEVPPELLEEAGVVAVHDHYSPFVDPYNVVVHADVHEFPDFPRAVRSRDPQPIADTSAFRLPDTTVLLSDIVGGQATGRTSESEITVFLNSGGLGVQFAAAGEVVLTKARRLGLGRELPKEWFYESRPEIQS